LREESLVFLFAESLFANGWTVRYEPPYGHPECADRGDLHAERERDRLWIEAKWWWFDPNLGAVLSSVESKLCREKGCKRLALVFAVDREDLRDSKQGLEMDSSRSG